MPGRDSLAGDGAAALGSAAYIFAKEKSLKVTSASQNPPYRLVGFAQICNIELAPCVASPSVSCVMLTETVLPSLSLFNGTSMKLSRPSLVDHPHHDSEGDSRSVVGGTHWVGVEWLG